MSDKIKFVKIGNITFVGFEKEADIKELNESLYAPQVTSIASPTVGNGVIPNASDFTASVEANKASQPILQKYKLLPGASNRILHRPRILIVDHDNNNISLAKCIGNPETLTVGTQMEFSYYNEDPDFEKFFLGETTAIPGLTLVK